MATYTTTGTSGVKIENLGLSFGPTPVLNGVNLEVLPGELFTFLGPSGSGKSTLLRAIAGFGPTPTGRILIGQDDIAGLAPWRRNVGMVFQSYALWPHMTVRRNVAFGLEERKMPASEIGPRVDTALDLVGLRHLADRRPSQLSGGQQQRVALARTIVVEPRVLLLDEPLSNLDANLRVQMRGEILDLQRKLGLTTIFVTHDQEEAHTMSDRMAVLDDGIIQQVGTPLELYDRPTNRFVANFLGTANLIDGTIREVHGQKQLVAGDGTQLPVDDVDLEPDQACIAMFRPQSVCMSSGAKQASEATISFTGKIEQREFLGNLIRYAVRVGAQQLTVDETHHLGGSVCEPGDQVGLSLERKYVRFLPA